MSAKYFIEDRVEAASVKDFLERYYKPSRYTGRGEEYAKILLDSYEREFAEDGYTFISEHDSVTGKIVAYISESLWKTLQPVERNG